MPRRLGQHFLRDRSVIDRINSSLELAPGERVLEIGPGEGVLTRALASTGAEVTAIELDSRLASTLRNSFSDEENVNIVEADALQIDPCDLMTLPYKLAGNIPYYITGSLFRKFIGETGCKPELAVLMVQLEVARRVLAKPGEMNLLAVGVQLYANPAMVVKVSRRSFNPPPRVDSAVIRLDVFGRPRVPVADERQFFAVVRAGFGTKRKQVVNALSQGLGIPKERAAVALAASDVAPTLRAQDLSLEDWSRLAEALS